MPLMLEPYRQQIAAFCRHFHVRRLEVFGSALRYDFNPERSDVDFLNPYVRAGIEAHRELVYAA